MVPSIPDGTILVVTDPSPFSYDDQSLFPTGILAVDPSTGEQPRVSTGGLFSAPTYITEAPNQRLYVSDFAAFGTGAVIQVDLNSGQQSLVSKGGFINGPNVLAFINGFLYVANEGDASGTVHNLVQIDPSTGQQRLITDGTNGDGFSVPTGIVRAPGNNAYVTDEPGNIQSSEPGSIWQVNLDTGRQTRIVRGGLLNHPVDIAVDASGNLMVINTGSDADVHSGSLIRVNPSTGVQRLISSFGPESGLNSIEIGQDGTIFIGAISSGNSAGRIYAVDPVTGAQRIISSGGELSLVEGLRVFHVGRQTDTTTTVVSSVNPALFGQSVTFTATISVQDAGAGTPTGTVQFQVDGSNTASPASVTASGGVITASLSISSLAMGAHLVTASYSGDSSFNSSTGILSGGQIVSNPGATTTTTTVRSSANASVFGQTVTFTATVSGQLPGGTPTGTVQFQIDGSNVGGPVSVATSGGLTTASFSIGSLAVGSHALTASYSGDANFASSSATLVSGQAVSKASTNTAVTSSANPLLPGQMATFTASISITAPGAGTPTGTVQFQIDGSNAGGSVSVSITSGVTTASFSTASLAAGPHTITASYSGDGSFDSSSGTLTGGQTVNKANTSTVVTSSANPLVFGQSVTFTATLSTAAPGAGTPTGTVQFQIDGSNAGTPVNVSTTGGVTTASFSTTSLAAGPHTITASYSGDGNFASSSATLGGGQLVMNGGDGNVIATLDQFQRVLRITGDTGNNAITIKQPAPGVLQVAGFGTSINQSSNPANFSSVTEINISLLSGNDSVTMDNFSIPGNISIIAGSGSNSIALTKITANIILIATTGPGKNNISLNNMAAANTTIATGDNATISLNAVSSADFVRLWAGSNATISLNAVTAAGDLNINVGDNAQSVTVIGSNSYNLNILQTGTTGKPSFDLENDTIRSNLNLTAGGGNNRLVLSHLNVAAQLLVVLGSGKNSVTADHLTALFGSIDGGPGGNNNYFDGGGNNGYSIFHFLGH